MNRIVEHNGTIYLAGIVSDDKELDIKVQANMASHNTLVELVVTAAKV